MCEEFNERGYRELIHSENVSEVCKKMIDETIDIIYEQLEACMNRDDWRAGKEERARLIRLIREGTFEEWMDEAGNNDITPTNYREE